MAKKATSTIGPRRLDDVASYAAAERKRAELKSLVGDRRKALDHAKAELAAVPSDAMVFDAEVSGLLDDTASGVAVAVDRNALAAAVDDAEHALAVAQRAYDAQVKIASTEREAARKRCCETRAVEHRAIITTMIERVEALADVCHEERRFCRELKADRLADRFDDAGSVIAGHPEVLPKPLRSMLMVFLKADRSWSGKLDRWLKKARDYVEAGESKGGA